MINSSICFVSGFLFNFFFCLLVCISRTFFRWNARNAVGRSSCPPSPPSHRRRDMGHSFGRDLLPINYVRKMLISYPYCDIEADIEAGFCMFSEARGTPRDLEASFSQFSDSRRRSIKIDQPEFGVTIWSTEVRECRLGAWWCLSMKRGQRLSHRFDRHRGILSFLLPGLGIDLE